MLDESVVGALMDHQVVRKLGSVMLDSEDRVRVAAAGALRYPLSPDGGFLGPGDGEGVPIHMPMIRLETVEKHRMYCLMPSDNFIVKKSGTQAGIEPTTFGGTDPLL